MRVGIQGWGSEGDLRPLIALAARLRSAGHEPKLVLSPVDGQDYRPLCRSLGLELRLVPEELPGSLRSICDASKSSDPGKVSRALMDIAFYPFVESMYRAALELCASCEVVVGLFSCWYVKAACLVSNRPFVSVHYHPGVVPSRVLPPLGLPAWRWLTPLAWAALGKLIEVTFGGRAGKFFAGKGLPSPSGLEPMLSDTLNLVGTSSSLFPPAPDWGETTRLCGHFELPGEAQPFQPSAGLRGFLEEGERPILVSFGTMELLAPERSRQLVVEAARLAKVRAIVQTKASGAPDEARDGDIYFLRWANHRHLLPRCSAMVLHGGAGTSHAALRAGVPAVVVPFIMEQKAWGALMHKAGVAVRPVPFWKASPQELARRIREALDSEAIRTRAAELAKRVAEEDGTGLAVELLERVARG